MAFFFFRREVKTERKKRKTEEEPIDTALTSLHRLSENRPEGNIGFLNGDLPRLHCDSELIQ